MCSFGICSIQLLLSDCFQHASLMSDHRNLSPTQTHTHTLMLKSNSINCRSAYQRAIGLPKLDLDSDGVQGEREKGEELLGMHTVCSTLDRTANIVFSR